MNRELLSGCSAGILSDCIVHPIETIKVNLQCQENKKFKNIIKTEGLRGFYRGFKPLIIASGPAHMLYFGGYEYSKKHIGNDNISIFISGLFGNASGGLFWTPMNVIKQREMASLKYQTSQSILKNIIKNHGIRGLYRGYFIDLSVYGPFSAIYFTIYENLKERVNKSRSERQLSFYYFGISAVSSAVGSILTCPLDVIKTRYQVNNNNLRDCVKEIIIKDGLKGFLRGMGARVSWIVPSCSLTMLFYEKFKKYNF